jgi:hypothetical protein
MSFNGEPIYIEVPDKRDMDISAQEAKDGGDFIYCIKSDLDEKTARNTKIAVVLISRDTDKFKIKKYLDS